LIFFNYSDGSIEPYTPEDWEQSEPNSQGYFNFDNNFWSCCANPDDISSGANPKLAHVNGISTQVPIL